LFAEQQLARMADNVSQQPDSICDGRGELENSTKAKTQYFKNGYGA
jgi:hypothetical protein